MDIGGSHITAALVDMNTRCILAHTRNRTSINAKGSKDDIMACWCNTISTCFKVENITPGSIGIAMPGPFDYGEGISFIKNQDKYDALYGINIKDLIAAALSLRRDDIMIINDAAAFLQGEMFSGAAKYCNNVLGITLGTGFGSARHTDNQTIDAELWCSPFLEGIAEDYFSSRWFVKRYQELSGKKRDNVKEIMALVETDATVSLLLEEFAVNLATFLAPIVKAEAIEVVVIGGNIAHAFDHFSASLKKQLWQTVPGIKIEKNKLGESAALIGAASNNR